MENERYIIYGAGKLGKAYYEFLKQKKLDSAIIGFYDQRYDEIAQSAHMNKIEFKRLFLQLDLSNVIELACGRGRHVPHYFNKSGSNYTC